MPKEKRGEGRKREREEKEREREREVDPESPKACVPTVWIGREEGREEEGGEREREKRERERRGPREPQGMCPDSMDYEASFELRTSSNFEVRSSKLEPRTSKFEVT